MYIYIYIHTRTRSYLLYISIYIYIYYIYTYVFCTYTVYCLSASQHSLDLPRKRKSDKKWKFAFPDFDGTRGSLLRIDLPILGALQPRGGWCFNRFVSKWRWSHYVSWRDSRASFFFFWMSGDWTKDIKYDVVILDVEFWAFTFWRFVENSPFCRGSRWFPFVPYAICVFVPQDSWIILSSTLMWTLGSTLGCLLWLWYMGLSIVMGVPQIAGWFLLGKMPSRNGWELGVPLFQETPISYYFQYTSNKWVYQSCWLA